MNKGQKRQKRKQVTLKQTHKISPLKEYIESQSNHQQLTHQKIQLSLLPNIETHLNPSEIAQTNKVIDALITIEFMKLCIKKQEGQLSEFYEKNHAEVEKIFTQALSSISEMFQRIKQEGLEGIDDEIQFIPPDHDLYETFFSEKLSEMLRDNCHFYNKQQNNDQLLQSFSNQIKIIENKIKEYSTQISRQSVESSLTKVEDEELTKNKSKTKRCFEELQQNLEFVFTLANSERALNRRKRENQQMKKEEERNFLKDTLAKKWNQNPFLFKCEDIFIS